MFPLNGRLGMAVRLAVPLAAALTLASGCASTAGQAGVATPGPDTPPTSPAPEVPKGTLRVSFLDIGQGDAALIQAPDGTGILIDGGPQDAGPKLLQALKAANLTRLEWIVGSHPHSDHIGGLIDILREVPTASALDPGYNHGTQLQKTYVKLLQEKGVKVTRARAGQTHNWGGATFEILAPEDPLLSGTESDANNNSIVGRLVFGQTRFLFTGDMEEDERARLLKSGISARLEASVLKVAHHGSHNGTDSAFLAAVKPKYAVISLAKGNEYGHPHREAMEALTNSKAEILRTDQRGTITFSSNGRDLTLDRTDRPAPAGGAEASTTLSFTGKVIGNSGSKVYHAADCPSLPAMNKRLEFESASVAEKMGFRKHGKCIR